MKKVISCILVLLAALMLTSCGEQQKTADIDVDLTKLSATMVYSEVNNMCTNPQSYVDKTVRMRGKMAIYPGEIRDYYACIVSDATACCAQGIEFLTKDGQYPQVDSDFTVIGRFEIYYEGPQMYIQLADSVVENVISP